MSTARFFHRSQEDAAQLANLTVDDQAMRLAVEFRLRKKIAVQAAARGLNERLHTI